LTDPPLNFWQFLTNLFGWFEMRTTRILALTLGTVTTLVGTGLIPETSLKYFAGAITILTYWRAQSISNTVANAKAIVHQQQVDAASPIKTYVLQASPPPSTEIPKT
jgi:hypothetical protein